MNTHGDFDKLSTTSKKHQISTWTGPELLHKYTQYNHSFNPCNIEATDTYFAIIDEILSRCDRHK